MFYLKIFCFDKAVFALACTVAMSAVTASSRPVGLSADYALHKRRCIADKTRKPS